MKWIPTFLMMMAVPAFADEPPSNGQGYCIGTEVCPYDWSLKNRSDGWTYDGIPIGTPDPNDPNCRPDRDDDTGRACRD
jgi:hypothetical protein